MVDKDGNSWKSFWKKAWSWTIAGIQTAIGIGLMFVPGAQGLGVALLASGATSMFSNVLSAMGINSKISSIASSISSIVIGFALLFTTFAAVGANLIGSGAGGVLGGYISEVLGFSFTAGSIIGSIVGSIIGGKIHKLWTGGFKTRADFKTHYNNHGIQWVILV